MGAATTGACTLAAVGASAWARVARVWLAGLDSGFVVQWIASALAFGLGASPWEPGSLAARTPCLARLLATVRTATGARVHLFLSVSCRSVTACPLPTSCTVVPAISHTVMDAVQYAPTVFLIRGCSPQTSPQTYGYAPVEYTFCPLTMVASTLGAGAPASTKSRCWASLYSIASVAAKD